MTIIYIGGFMVLCLVLGGYGLSCFLDWISRP